MKPHRLPASVRYLKARLRPLSSPAFWVSSSVVLVALLVLWEAWTNPELVRSWSSRFTPKPVATNLESDPSEAEAQPPESQISDLTPEQQALLDNLENVSVSAAPDPSKLPKTSEQKKPAPLKTSKAASVDNIIPSLAQINPFASYSQNNPFSSTNTGPNMPGLGGSLLFPNNAAAGTSNPSPNATPQATPANPLQAALERSTPTEATENDSEAIAQVNPATDGLRPEAYGLIAPASDRPVLAVPQSNYNSPALPSTSIPNSLPPNAYNYLNQTAPTPAIPAPANSAIPITPSYNYGQYPSQNAVPSAVPNNSTYNPNYTSPGLQPSQLSPAAPFSVNSPVPGRRLGGGQIRTFSNP